jgi:hypothetical protein
MQARSPGTDLELNHANNSKERSGRDFGIEKPCDVGMQLHITTIDRAWMWNVKKYDYTSFVEHLKNIDEPYKCLNPSCKVLHLTLGCALH